MKGYEYAHVPKFMPERQKGWFGKSVLFEVNRGTVNGAINTGGERCGFWVSMSEIWPLLIGRSMEETVEKLKEVTAECEKGRNSLRDLEGEVRALAEIIKPQIENRTAEIRSLRMSLVSELNQSLASLREVRRFFLDADYRQEIDRLKEFVSVCKELQKLKADGVLDAVCDSAIRLALKEKV